MTTQVGNKDGWYVGDKAYVWRRHCKIPEYSGTFSRWVKGEITTLFSDGSLVLKTGKDPGQLLASYTAKIYTKKAAYAINEGMFPISTRVVLLSSYPRAGLLGTVITFDEARQAGPALFLDEDKFISVMLDQKYVGGWYPESLGIIDNLVAVVPSEPEPKNNDGRSTCFWCGAPTKTFELAFNNGNVCTQCGR